MSDDALNFRLTATDLASKKIATVKTGLGGLATQAKSSILTGVGLGAGVVGFQLLGDAVAGVTGYVKDAIGAASALNESQNKVSVVFGTSASKVLDFSKTTASALGVSKNEALAAAGGFGNMFRTIGLAGAESANMSTKLVTLAADMASFNDTDPSDMLIKLKAGLAGEAEPLRTMGVLLSEARVKAEGMAMGLADSHGQLSEAAKVQARYSLILKDTAIQQGDFARTSDSLANMQRQLTAEWADMQTEIGQQLLPIMVGLAKFVRDDLIPAIKDIGKAISNTVDDMAQIGQAWATVGMDFGDMGDRIHRIADKFDRSFQTTKDHIKHYMLDMGMSFEEAADRAEADLAGRMVKGVVHGMGGVANAVKGGKPAVTRAMDEVSAEGVLNPLYHGFATAVAAARKLPVDIASAIRGSRDNVKTQMDLLKDDITNSVNEATRQAKLQAMLLDPAIVEGMKSGDPLVKAQAEATRLAILNSMGVEDTFQWGWAVGKSWLKGLTAGVGDAVQRQGLANRLREYQAQLEGRSPPREGPLKNIDKGGFNIGKAWSSAFSAGLAGATIPSMPSLSMPGGMAMAGASGGGAAITINVNAPLGTPAAGQALARLLVPELTRELRRQRVL